MVFILERDMKDKEHAVGMLLGSYMPGRYIYGGQSDPDIYPSIQRSIHM